MNLNAKQVDELVELLEKEEIIEFEGKAEKAVQKHKDLDSKESADSKSDQGKPEASDKAKPPPPISKVDPKSSNTMIPPITSIDSKLQKKSQNSKSV